VLAEVLTDVESDPDDLLRLWLIAALGTLTCGFSVGAAGFEPATSCV
jgi:hypothetical protein